MQPGREWADGVQDVLRQTVREKVVRLHELLRLLRSWLTEGDRLMVEIAFFACNFEHFLNTYLSLCGRLDLATGTELTVRLLTYSPEQLEEWLDAPD